MNLHKLKKIDKDLTKIINYLSIVRSRIPYVPLTSEPHRAPKFILSPLFSALTPPPTKKGSPPN